MNENQTPDIHRGAGKGNAHKFAFSSAVFQKIQLKFELHLDLNAVTENLKSYQLAETRICLNLSPQVALRSLKK